MPFVLKGIFDHVLCADFIPDLGEIDEVVLYAHAEYALEIRRVFLRPIVEEGPVFMLVGEQVNAAGRVFSDDQWHCTGVESP